MPIYGPVDVGDVLVTSEGPKLVKDAIETGAWLTGDPHDVNHAIVVHHYDKDMDRWWGLEGKPGGVGWRDLTQVLTWHTTFANNEQPKTDTQRFYIAKSAEDLLHLPYDWRAIVHDARIATRLDHLFNSDEWDEDQVPNQVVCSSYADWAYEHQLVRLANPGGDSVTRFTTPGHWKRFIINREWT